MSAPERIYLDSAATSFPKPPGVLEAVEFYLRDLGAPFGRSATHKAGEVQRVVARTRQRAAELLGARRPEQVVFTFNGTDALSQAIQGLVGSEDRVVTTTWEHNSVLRPLKTLTQRKQIQVAYIGPDEQGQVDRDQFDAAFASPVKLLVITHASNVTGILQPVRELAELAHQQGALVLVDAAQTAGHVPVTFDDLQADLIACPGHKGLLGPLGTGILAMQEELFERVEPLRQGGTGSQSESESQPDQSPERFESGSHNLPGLFGLNASLEWILETSVATLAAHEHELIHSLVAGLREIPRVIVHDFGGQVPRVGVVSFTINGTQPQVIASLLEEHFGVECRAGLHCAPRAHQALGTFENGGTVRLSVGPFTTAEHVDAALEAVAQIAVAV